MSGLAGGGLTGGGVGGSYQPGVYVPLKALFLVSSDIVLLVRCLKCFTTDRSAHLSLCTVQLFMRKCVFGDMGYCVKKLQ